MQKLVFLTLLAAIAWLSTPARAASPPALPLPACVDSQGACPKLNPLVTGTAPGTLTAGGSILIATMPTGPVCNGMDGYSYIWTPNACFAGVHKPVIVTCAYIDLKDMKFKEMNCQSALYKVPSQAPAPLFTLKRPDGNTDYGGSTACGADADYETFAYGGPFTIKESIWVNRGDRARFCELTMAAKRPDGLYGPTWAKVRVGISYGENGIGRSGRAETAEFYIPIDGDVRDLGADLDVTGTATIDNAAWDLGRVTATYRATLWNKGATDAENVKVTFELPVELKYEGTGEGTCAPAEATANPSKRGGTVNCSGFGVDAGRFHTLEIQVRVVNATDLNARQQGLLPQGALPRPQERGLKIEAKADNDVDSSNNSTVVALDIPFREGSTVVTLQLMSLLNSSFAYENARRAQGCNQYKEDIFAQLEAARARNPFAFANLSYGPVSSGDYYILDYFKAGHVGVVVYQKGTDYRKTGIIINGTPFPSPLSGVSYVGSNDQFYGFPRVGFTALDGNLLRTPVNSFPNLPFEESGGGNKPYGFEGRYAYNSDEFGGNPDPINPGPDSPTSDDAIVVNTQSPVEILLTNSRGQRVETRGGKIVMQELDGAIWSMASPHEDGTFAWTIALPPDRYDVQLRGIANGPYRLTLATYTDGIAKETVTDGQTLPDQINQYSVDAPPGTTKGGGALDLWVLLALCGLLTLRRDSATDHWRRPGWIKL